MTSEQKTEILNLVKSQLESILEAEIVSEKFKSKIEKTDIANNDLLSEPERFILKAKVSLRFHNDSLSFDILNTLWFRHKKKFHLLFGNLRSLNFSIQFCNIYYFLKIPLPLS